MARNTKGGPMSKSGVKKFKDRILEAHAIGVKNAIEASERTGVPLVIYKEGKIQLLKPKYKYVRVKIAQKKKRSK